MSKKPIASKIRISTGLSGVAGEYFVAAELSRLGFLASMTMRNAKGVDILVTNSQAARTAAIQVKARQDGARTGVLRGVVSLQKMVAAKMGVDLDDSVIESIVSRLKLIY